jgi:hypothetical protein
MGDERMNDTREMQSFDIPADNFTYNDVTITDDEMGDFTFYRIIKPDGSSMGDIHSEDDAAMLVELLNRG